MRALVFSPPFERTGGGGTVAPTTATQSGSSLATAGAPPVHDHAGPASRPDLRSPGRAAAARRPGRKHHHGRPDLRQRHEHLVGRRFQPHGGLHHQPRPDALLAALSQSTSRRPAPLPALTLLTAGAGTTLDPVPTFQARDVPNGARWRGPAIGVKSTWPDGSAKIALVSGVAAATGHALGRSRTAHQHRMADAGAASRHGYLGGHWHRRARALLPGRPTQRIGAPFHGGAGGPGVVVDFRKPIGSDTHLTPGWKCASTDRRCRSGAVDRERLPDGDGADRQAGTYKLHAGRDIALQHVDAGLSPHTPAAAGRFDALYWLGTDKSVALKRPRSLSRVHRPDEQVAGFSGSANGTMDGVSTENHRMWAVHAIRVARRAGETPARPLYAPSSMGSGGATEHRCAKPASGGRLSLGTNTNGVPFRQLPQEGYRFGAYQTTTEDGAQIPIPLLAAR